MDWLTFISNSISALAWPVVALILMFFLRKNLVNLADRLQELTLPGGTKAIFRKELDEARRSAETLSVAGDAAQSRLQTPPNDKILELAKTFPEAAILEAYKDVERVIFQLETDDEKRGGQNPTEIVMTLFSMGFISDEVVNLFKRVRSVRNAAVHVTGKTITPGEALEYRALCLDLIQSLGEGFSKLEKRASQ